MEHGCCSCTCTASISEVSVCSSILFIGLPFKYVIPSFTMLKVEQRQLKIMGYDSEDEEKQYNFFIRHSPSLCHKYSAWMVLLQLTEECPAVCGQHL